MLIIADKGVLHSGLLAKYFAAFLERSILSEVWGLGSPNFLSHAYKLCVVVSLCNVWTS